METLFKSLLFFVFACGLTTSCEKAILEEEDAADDGSKTSKKSGEGEKGNVTLRVAEFRIVPFDTNETRAMTDLTAYCTRLNFVVYQNGKKVEGLSQLKEDGHFGEVTMSLAAGTYKLLVLAHSSVGGNPVVSNAESIKFTNALCYSDTFSYYGDLEVTGQSQSHDIILTRNVSCLNFTIQDEFPAEVKYVRFFYTGGSGVLNAVTGYGGNVNSQQEKVVDISSFTPPITFHLYTFLQQDEAMLQLTVSALQADKSTVVVERTFENIPMKHRMVTEYTGYFFNSSNGYTLTAETDWGDAYHQHTY